MNVANTQCADVDWLEIDDFHNRLRALVTPSAIEAMMGSRILDISPGLVGDFLDFDSNVPNPSRGLPRRPVPGAWRTRDKLLASIKAWTQLANKTSDCTKNGPEDYDWAEFFGTRLIKARGESLRAAGLDDDAMAGESLVLLLG